MKYRVEVQADSSGEWVGNGLEFDSEAQAKAYGADLFMRWTAVREWRVVPVEPRYSDEQAAAADWEGYARQFDR
jgi:hypothetical protein